MGSFCTKRAWGFAASSINTESVTDLNKGEPIHVGVKEPKNGTTLRNRKGNNNNIKHIKSDTSSPSKSSSSSYSTSTSSSSTTSYNNKEEEEENITLYDSNGQPVSVSQLKKENDSSSSDDNDSNNSVKEIVATPQTRSQMESYWNEHSNSKINKSLMLLMEDNPDFEELERKEIMNYLPNFENLDCIELGAGIGRFTNELGKGGVKSLLAIDFIEKFIKVNENTHKNLYPNINMKFKCQDVTTLVLDNLSFDFVFSNWLMMYLDDNETIKLAEKMYKWCRYDGYIFFRESCKGGASGDKKRSFNPTYYRNNEYYTNLFLNLSKRLNDDNNCKLVKISVNKVKIYVDLKNKTNQYCWLFQKKRIKQ